MNILTAYLSLSVAMHASFKFFIHEDYNFYLHKHERDMSVHYFSSVIARGSYNTEILIPDAI